MILMSIGMSLIGQSGRQDETIALDIPALLPAYSHNMNSSDAAFCFMRVHVQKITLYM